MCDSTKGGRRAVNFGSEIDWRKNVSAVRDGKEVDGTRHMPVTFLNSGSRN